jgi:hypothetical protein
MRGRPDTARPSLVPRRGALLLSAIALLAIGGVAVAASGGGSNGVTLCVAKGSGEVFLGGKGKCGKGEKKLVVGKRGPAGPRGAQGLAGPAGADGKALALTAEAAHTVGAAAGQCKANPGTFCGTPGAIGTWSPNFQSELTYRKDAAGWVYVTGNARAAEGGSEDQYDEIETIFYLPPGFRPTDGIHRFYVSASSCHNPGYISYVDVLPNGAVLPPSPGGCIGLSKLVFHP